MSKNPICQKCEFWADSRNQCTFEGDCPHNPYVTDQPEPPQIDEAFIEKWRGILEENGDIENYEGILNVVLDEEDLKKMLIEAGVKIKK